MTSSYILIRALELLESIARRKGYDRLDSESKADLCYAIMYVKQQIKDNG